MHGFLAATALRNAQMELNRGKRPMRQFKSDKTLRKSFASTGSLAVGSVRALYHASRTKLNRLLRKDRFKSECRYCDEGVDAEGIRAHHEHVDAHNHDSLADGAHELIELPPTNQGPTAHFTAQERSTTPSSSEDGSAGVQQGSTSST